MTPTLFSLSLALSFPLSHLSSADGSCRQVNVWEMREDNSAVMLCSVF